MASQADVHSLFGGVVPEIASREHLRMLGPLLEALLADTGARLKDVDVVAVARGPGLLGSLLVGLGLAKGLALGLGARLVGVNHLWAHLLAPGLEQPIPFPAMGLLISGGHTHLYHVRSHLEFELLGRTLDDAAGEAFDKVAKILNLPYPGGKYIDILGNTAEPDKTLFPRPYLDNLNLDFSFSGIKTAVAKHVASHPQVRLARLVRPEDAAAEVARIAAEGDGELARVCASFSLSMAETLRVKLERALARTPEVRSIVVAGGVAANSVIRRTMAEVAARHGLELVLPRLELCTDNGAMIAFLGAETVKAGWCHDLGLEAVPRGKPIPWDLHRA
jgi:N6-L-threonylcarbamoyladenine synthase